MMQVTYRDKFLNLQFPKGKSVGDPYSRRRGAENWGCFHLSDNRRCKLVKAEANSERIYGAILRNDQQLADGILPL